MSAPPPGFAPHFRKSPLTDPWEPLWSRRDGAALVLGLEIGERHCNARGTAHGGLISALADNAMGLACALGADPPHSIVTAHLSIDLVGAARIGDWIEFHAAPARIGRALAFAGCEVRGAGGLIARASGVFSVAVPPAA